MSEDPNFKLNDQIAVKFGGQNVVGKLIGIDSYSLESFDGKKCGWPSFTLVSDRKDKFKRFWFVLWENKNWVLWLEAKSMTVPKGSKLIPEKSGIAKIEFEGDSGVSTPFAALAQYKVGRDYFSLERFAGSDVMYFSGHRIAKPKVEPGG